MATQGGRVGGMGDTSRLGDGEAEGAAAGEGEASGDGVAEGAATGEGEASGEGAGEVEGEPEGEGVGEAAPRHRKLVVVSSAQGADCVHQAE